jgi:hypothetical protein
MIMKRSQLDLSLGYGPVMSSAGHLHQHVAGEGPTGDSTKAAVETMTRSVRRTTSALLTDQPMLTNSLIILQNIDHCPT